MNPDHFADARWEDVISCSSVEEAEQPSTRSESADERWITWALCDSYND